MKRFVGAVIGAFMILLAVLAAIPYALAAAMKSVAKIDQANCGVLTNTVTFTADQVTAAYGATPPPGDPARIAADLNAASIALDPRIIEWFDATTTITLLATTASISDPAWTPLAALRPTGAGTDTEPEGPTLPSTTIDPTMPPAAPATPAVTLANVLATIRAKESGGNYHAHAGTGSASGAYQFTDNTWNNFRGYAHASDAPASVQDEAAGLHVAPLLAHFGLGGVPVGWYYPAALNDPSWMDRVPHPENGNTLTVRQYQTEWLAIYTQITGGLPADLATAVNTCTPPVGGADAATGTTATVTSSCSGQITIDESIASRVQSLLEHACADGIAFTGGGWRSAQAQIELRRAHCGPTDYEIYQRPADECQPPTARPGNSMHEKGLAIDFATGANGLSRATIGYRWLVLNARTYGLYNLASEPWHWSTNGR